MQPITIIKDDCISENHNHQRHQRAMIIGMVSAKIITIITINTCKICSDKSKSVVSPHYPKQQNSIQKITDEYASTY